MLFILLMQNVWKYVDDLIGKGLEWPIILEIVFYIIPTLIPLALPLAILLSSLMAFGKLGETYELTALKSSGISLYQIMKPLFIVVTIVSITVFFFSNHVIPYSNMKFKTLLYDVMNKKLALNIREGVFFDDIEGYSIKVNHKENNNKLRDILIYDHSERMGNTKVIKAESGYMYGSEDGRYLYLNLINGHSYEELDSKNPKKRIDLPFARSSFRKQKIRFDMSSFEFDRSEEEKYSNVAQFMNLKQLNQNHDSLKTLINNKLHTISEKMNSYYSFHLLKSHVLSNQNVKSFDIHSLEKNKKNRLIKAASRQIKSCNSFIYNVQRELNYKNKQLKKTAIEWHRKFSLSFACIVLFLIGAPLGSIIRKGGLGIPVLISIIFFLAYHITSITGEKSALQGVISIPLGMWMSTIILTPLGLFFTIKSSKDQPLFDADFINQFKQKIIDLWSQKTS